MNRKILGNNRLLGINKKRLDTYSGVTSSLNDNKKYYDFLIQSGLYNNTKLAWLSVFGTSIRTSGIDKYATRLFSINNQTTEFGNELIINGGFDVDSNWVKGGTWVISGGTANVSSNSDLQQQNITGVISGKRYRISLNITQRTSGSLDRIYLGATASTFVGWNTLGYKYFDMICDGNVLLIRAGDFRGSIDDVSVREVLQYDLKQDTTSSQPFLTGHIAPNEKMGVKLSYQRWSQSISHPVISFGISDPWSVTCVLNKIPHSSWYQTDFFGTNIGGINYGVSSTNSQFGFKNTLGWGSCNLSIIPHRGKTVIYTFVFGGNKNLKIYVNGQLSSNTTFSYDTSITLSRIFHGPVNAGGNEVFGGSYYGYIVRSQSLTPTQVLNEYNVLRSIYPEIESIDIGDTTEKLINGNFGSDLNNWVIGGNNSTNTVTYEDGSCRFISDGSTSLYLLQSNSTIIGKRYKISINVKSISGTGIKLQFGSGGIIDSKIGYITSIGTYVFYSEADGTNFTIHRRTGGTSTNVLFDSVSCVELPQTFSSSNCELISTQQGNNIGNITWNSLVEKCTNTGLSGGTDWVDTNADGLADGVTKERTTCIASIVTGNGFVGNAQRVESTAAGSPNWASILQLKTGLSGLGYCKITFKYRSNKTIWIDTSTISTPFPINTGNAISGQTICLNQGRLLCGFGVTDSIGDWMEIDELSIQEYGWNNANDLYTEIYNKTSGTVEQKTYAGVKAASMWRYCSNDNVRGSIFGKQYNWYATKLIQMDIDYYNTSNPTNTYGWRVPNKLDYDLLSTYLGNNGGDKLKTVGSTYWNSWNSGSTNFTGFSALGTGYIDIDGNTQLTGLVTKFWTVTENDSTSSFCIGLNSDYSTIYDISSRDKRLGYPIRLIKT